MTEPASTTSGVGLVVALVALLGPAAGEYATILFAALAGALWPLSAAAGITRAAGALMVLRLVLTAFALTGVIAWWVQSTWHVPATTILAPVAFGISALGDNWRPLISAVVARASALVSGHSNDTTGKT